MQNSFDCYPYITLIDSEALITTCVDDSFNYASFKYIDLTFYGGSEYTRVTSDSEIVAAFLSLGYEVVINECKIYILDDTLSNLEDVEVLNDPTITIDHIDDISVCNGVSFLYSQFDFVDLSFYGGGYVPITSQADLINAFSNLGITITVGIMCKITLVDWADKPISDITAYSNPQAQIVDNTNPITGFDNTDISTFDCVDLSFYGGSDCFRADSFENIRAELQSLTGVTVTVNSGIFEFILYLNNVQNIEADEFPSIILEDTNEGLNPICVSNAYQYGDKFDYIDLSYYGGATSVRVENNSDVIDAFSNLGITVSFDNCNIIIQDCCITPKNVEVHADPRISLIDTDEGLTVCSGGVYQYSNFDEIDLTPYGGVKVPVSNDTDVENQLSALGVTAEVDGCEIKLINFQGSPVDIEVCKYKQINLVDTDEGITVCNAGSIVYANFDKVDFSPYGGISKEINNETELIQELELLTGYNVTVVNCDIIIDSCDINEFDLEVSRDRVPVCSSSAVIPTEDCDDPSFEICFGGWISDGSGGMYNLDNGDRLIMIVRDTNNNPISTANMIVGENPTLPTGVINSLNWIPNVTCTTASTEIACYLESKILDRVELKNGNACFEFDRDGYADANGLFTLDADGNKIYEDIVFSFAVWDASTGLFSSACEETINVNIDYLRHSFVAPIKPGTPLTLNQNPNTAHSQHGGYVYTQAQFPTAVHPYPYSYDFDNAPFNMLDSLGNPLENPIQLTSCFWDGDTIGGGCRGRLFYVGLWNTSISASQWIGFTKCLVVPSTKTYFIGFGADNAGRLTIDGDLIVELLPDANSLGEDRAFKRWWMVEVELTAGCHLIQMEGRNYGLNGAFGAEIYDNTISELQAATSTADLNIIFTTEDYVGEQTDPLTTNVPGGIFCPSCYELEFQGCCLPRCVRNPEEILCDGEDPDCISECDTWDMTFSSPSPGRIQWGALTNDYNPFTTYEISWFTEYGGSGEVLRFKNGSPPVTGNGPTGNITSLPPGVYSPVITNIDGVAVEYNCLGHVRVN